MRNRVAGMVLLCIMLALSVAAHAGPATDLVKDKSEAVIKVLKDPALKGESGLKAKRDKIRTIGERMFDFVEMSKRTLGLNWNKLNAPQRQEFVELFEALLEDAYADKISSYTDEKVTFTKEVVLSEKTVEVQSVILWKNTDVPVFYRMMSKDGQWRVYDVLIEGVSLVSNYRTQFREILGNNPPEQLLETLRKKVGKR
jgi:phospholipid transport system substrate-binding protein